MTCDRLKWSLGSELLLNYSLPTREFGPYRRLHFLRYTTTGILTLVSPKQ